MIYIGGKIVNKSLRTSLKLLEFQSRILFKTSFLHKTWLYMVNVYTLNGVLRGFINR